MGVVRIHALGRQVQQGRVIVVRMGLPPQEERVVVVVPEQLQLIKMAELDFIFPFQALLYLMREEVGG